VGSEMCIRDRYCSDRVGDQEWYQVYTYHETPVSYGWVLPTLFRDSF